MATVMKFTKASAKDSQSRVTVTASQLNIYDEDNAAVLTVKHDNKSYDILFKRNRQGTFKTTSWPADLMEPEVSSPCWFIVTNVDTIPDYLFRG